MISARTKFWLRCLASLALLTVIATKVNWAALGAILFRINIPIAASTSALTPLLILMLTLRWRIFLRQQEIDLPFGKIFGLTWAGQFFNSVLPGSIGGDVVKIYQVCRMYPDKKAASMVTVVTDRLCALFALGVLAATGFFFGPTFQIIQAGLFVIPKWLWPLAGLAVLGLLFVFSSLKLRHSPWVERMRQFFLILKTSLQWNGRLAAAVMLSFCIHFLSFTIFFGFARSLGILISYEQVLTMMPVVMALLLLPLTINGHGLREVLLIFYFSTWSIPVSGPATSGVTSLVVSLSILAVASDMLWSLPGGLWYFFSPANK